RAAGRAPGPRARRARAAGGGGGTPAVTLTLASIEAIGAGPGAGEAIEALLPPAARGRQLTAGTLLAGKMPALADGRPAHLTRAHAALTGLPEHDQKRLGGIEDWKDGPHQLTYRPVEAHSPPINKAT